MTRRAFALVLLGACALVCALSTGSQAYYLAALCFALTLCFSLLSVMLGVMFTRFSLHAQKNQVMRGEDITFHINYQNNCFLPLSAGECTLRACDETYVLPAPFAPFKKRLATFTLPARHVGTYACRVEHFTVKDIFGLFEMRRKGKENLILFILPKPFDIEKPSFASGDTGNAALARSQEDYTSPEDTRSYQPGDAMKRIHWKLSSRKRELLVRRYETPAPPDTLILTDPSRPKADTKEKALDLRDALCETAVAVAHLQLMDLSPVRVPFYGEYANEFSADNPLALPLLQEILARQPFDKQEDFARILHMELRRMGRTGAVIIITHALSPLMVDAVGQIRRMGPHVRLYLVTHTPESESDRPMVTQLQHHLVEVCYVTPA